MNIPSTCWALRDSNHRGGREHSCRRTGSGQGGRPRVQTCGGRVRWGQRLIHRWAALQEEPVARRKEGTMRVWCYNQESHAVFTACKPKFIYEMNWDGLLWSRDKSSGGKKGWCQFLQCTDQIFATLGQNILKHSVDLFGCGLETSALQYD